MNQSLTPEYWLERAEETRAKAERILISERERERLLKVAVEYEQLALRATRWQVEAEQHWK
ncbi:hypothetical protein [Bradyrhizobium ivorense]|uniref:hypothetical protein n=1 Tax=Bradyrhizobium ivorense TaxID=2511166 RepID=UPI0010B34F7B|nr:hypothetical protein [Bradyrhizobium ivorense]VIO77013.1 hypothetical protein CI41S_54030 [Bradyrhizobium ivorense]